MEATLKCIIQYVDASLVYTTPYVWGWHAYYDSLLHSLVEKERRHRHVLDMAPIVYSYN